MFIKEEKGSATVEAAILIPLLLTIFLAFIFLNNIVKETMVLESAAKEGAKTYAMTGNISMAINTAKNEVKKGGIKPENVIITPLSKGDSRGMRVIKETLLIKIVNFLSVEKSSIKGEMYYHKAF